MESNQKTVLTRIIAVLLVISVVGGGVFNGSILQKRSMEINNENDKNMFAYNELPVVYDGMTLNELATKLNKSLKNDLKGQGKLIATYSLEKGVDPYIAVAIMLQETGCGQNKCSRVVTVCNNVGGQKESGKSACGAYRSFSSIEEGIKGFINNLSKNYFAKGLNTPAKMNSKYAADKTWKDKVNRYVERIKKA